MIKSILIGALTSSLPMLLVQVLPSLFPYHSPPGATRWTLAQLKRLYARADAFLFYPKWIGLIAASFVWSLPLLGLRSIIYPDPGTPGMIMTPWWFYWVVAAVLGGVLTMVAAWHSILRRVLGRRYGEYCLYRRWQAGRALPVLYKAATAAGVPVLIIAVYTLSATYTVFGTARIVISQAYHQSASYPYYDIVEIRAIRLRRKETSNRVRGRYEIEFPDGTVWHASTAFNAFNWTEPCATFPYIAFAAERSRRPITGPDLYAEEGCE